MERIIDRIKYPSDLKSLKKHDLSILAKEIRDEIIKTVSVTGGHLASNLGVVELAIALHYVFDTPEDKIIWDVGHQSYAHKILTGRRDRFSSLRQYKGICGFPRRDESIYDVFGTGHSSTSISAALGMAVGRDLKGMKNNIVAVIGDGAMTAGLAYEAINQAGHLRKKLIVILNDNEWSISPNVGAIAAYLNKIMTGRRVSVFRKEIKRFLKRVPFVGNHLYLLMKRVEEFTKGFLTPGILFEELGFRYIGPIPGHSIGDLIDTLENIKKLNDKPILLHVITEKGKGYRPAEENPEIFHSVGPFDISSGTPHSISDKKTYTDAFSEYIVRFAHEDKKIVAITAAMREGTGLSRFAKEFPNRFFDVGIAEQHAVTFAAGLAVEGFKPVVAIYSTFLQRAYDQIIHDVCIQNLPVVFAIDRAGIVGADGETHQGVFDLSYLRHIPNMVVMAPKDGHELGDMLKTALLLNRPVAIRYPRSEIVGKDIKDKPEPIPCGKAELLREGKDVVIVAIGSMVYPSLEAAFYLEKEGIDAAVINARFLKPMDEELLINWSLLTRNVITVEENVLLGGFGSAFLEMLERNRITGVKIRRMGIGDLFVTHGSQKILRSSFGLDSEGIANETIFMLKNLSRI